LTLGAILEKEDCLFRILLVSHAPECRRLSAIAKAERRSAGRLRAVDSTVLGLDGFRLICFHSLVKEERDAQERRESTPRAISGLEELNAKVESARSRLKTKQEIAEKPEQILSPWAFRG
jgi:hypothetical protein